MKVKDAGSSISCSSGDVLCPRLHCGRCLLRAAAPCVGVCGREAYMTLITWFQSAASIDSRHNLARSVPTSSEAIRRSVCSAVAARRPRAAPSGSIHGTGGVSVHAGTYYLQSEPPPPVCQHYLQACRLPVHQHVRPETRRFNSAGGVCALQTKREWFEALVNLALGSLSELFPTVIWT